MGSYGHKSEWELPLTFTPKPLQAVCYCLSTHQCIEFTQWIPFFIRKEVRMEGSGSKTRSKWKSKLLRQENPNDLEFAQRVGLRALPSHWELLPGDFLSLDWGKKPAGSAGPLKVTGCFPRTSSTRLFIFSSVSTGPCSSISPRRAGINYKAHVLLLRGTATLHRNQENLLSVFLRYSDAWRCNIKAVLHNQQKSPAQLTPEKDTLL